MLNQNSSEYKIDNKNSICFDRGSFDDYCVFLKKFDNNNNLISKKAVKDIELFDNLLIFKKEYKDKVYKLIKFIFDHSHSLDFFVLLHSRPWNIKLQKMRVVALPNSVEYSVLTRCP